MQVSKVAVSNQFSVNQTQKSRVQNQPSFGKEVIPGWGEVIHLPQLPKVLDLVNSVLGGKHTQHISLPIFHPEKLAPDVLERVRSGAVNAHIVPKE